MQTLHTALFLVFITSFLVSTPSHAAPTAAEVMTIAQRQLAAPR